MSHAGGLERYRVAPFRGGVYVRTMPRVLSQDQYILMVLLIEVGVMAAFATVLARFEPFTSRIFNEKRSAEDRAYIALLL